MFYWFLNTNVRTLSWKIFLKLNFTHLIPLSKKWHLNFHKFIVHDCIVISLFNNIPTFNTRIPLFSDSNICNASKRDLWRYSWKKHFCSKAESCFWLHISSPSLTVYLFITFFPGANVWCCISQKFIKIRRAFHILLQ